MVPAATLNGSAPASLLRVSGAPGDLLALHRAGKSDEDVVLIRQTAAVPDTDTDTDGRIPMLIPSPPPTNR